MEQIVKPGFHERRKHKRKHKSEKHDNSYFTLGLDAGLCTNQSTTAGTSTRIKFFPFSRSCACAYACAATSENETDHKNIYHTWLCLANENTESRLPRA